MYRITSVPIFAIICIFVLFSCKLSKEQAPADPAVNQTATEKPKVEVLDLTRTNFYKEILGNGKLFAVRKADLKFRVSEVIEQIRVKNGDLVEKGSVIATLSNFTFSNRLDKTRIMVEKAQIDMQDYLIGQGFPELDSTKIPLKIWKFGAIRSGLGHAEAELESAEYDFNNTVLYAPFKGIVANIKLKPQNLASLSDPFCTLIDNSAFEAVFQVLESELPGLTPGQPANVIPFAVDTMLREGRITEINPIVDENGLVTVKALVPNIRNALFEGMNVRVSIRKVVPGQLVVPKQAVVQRQGREVVFVLEDGLAKWNYVKTGTENSTSYTITEGLQPGMQVIISGNLNLAHDAEVEVR